MFGVHNDWIVVFGFWALLIGYVRLQCAHTLRQEGIRRRIRRDPYDLATLNTLVREQELRGACAPERPERRGKDMLGTVTHTHAAPITGARYLGVHRTDRKG